MKDTPPNTNIEDGIATWKDKRGNDRADRAADEGVKNHSDEICNQQNPSQKATRIHTVH